MARRRCAGICKRVRSLPAEKRRTFRSHPVKIVVGPSPDIFSRIVAEHLQQVWGQPVIVEPRPGAGGKLAVNSVSTARPRRPHHAVRLADLHAQHRDEDGGLRPDGEFVPVANIGVISYALVVHPSVPGSRPWPSLSPMPSKTPASSTAHRAGIGTVPHLACEYLNKVAGISILHVPYRDVNSGTMATVGNVTQMFSASRPAPSRRSTQGAARARREHGEALWCRCRPADHGGVGLSDVRHAGPSGLLATAGTPTDVVDKINQEVQRAVLKPETQKRLIAAGMETPPPMVPPRSRPSSRAMHQALDRLRQRGRHRQADARSRKSAKSAPGQALAAPCRSSRRASSAAMGGARRIVRPPESWPSHLRARSLRSLAPQGDADIPREACAYSEAATGAATPRAAGAASPRPQKNGSSSA